MAQPALTPFADQDEFLRRVSFDDHFKHDLLLWKAFKERDARMSWTFRDDDLRTIGGLDAYHSYFSEGFGQPLAAILRFTFYGLTQCIDPPMEPRLNPDPHDPKYGHLHCSTNCPRDKAHMELLAKLVHDGEHAGIARRYPKRVA
jgi:hypothetical protein